MKLTARKSKMWFAASPSVSSKQKKKKRNKKKRQRESNTNLDLRLEMIHFSPPPGEAEPNETEQASPTGPQCQHPTRHVEEDSITLGQTPQRLDSVPARKLISPDELTLGIWEVVNKVGN